MPYVSGTAANADALLSAIASFLVTEGWTLERSSAGAFEVTRSVTRGGGPLSRGFGVSTTMAPSPWGGTQGPSLMVVPWDTYDAGNLWYTQAGRPQTESGANTLGVGSAIGTTDMPYHLFSSANGEQVCIVVGRLTGVLNYVGLGFLEDADKFGAWDGWQYCFGARGLHSGGLSEINQNQFSQNSDSLTIPPLPPGGQIGAGTLNITPTLIAVDSDGSGVEWHGASDSTQAANLRTRLRINGWFTREGSSRSQNTDAVGGLPEMKHLWVRSRSGLAQNIVVLPCHVSVYRPLTLRWAPLCRLPLVHTCFTSGAVGEGAQFSIGPDTYRAFNSYAVREIPAI